MFFYNLFFTFFSIVCQGVYLYFAYRTYHFAFTFVFVAEFTL